MGGQREPGAGRWVGIDLGTTFSAVASVDAFGRALVLPNRDGERTTPSVVFFDGEQPLVGTMARRSVATSPLDAVRFVKRAMGDPAWRFETSRGTGYGPEEISALILKRLKEDAERALSSEVTDAVITVPAYFDDAARRATIAAGTIAGLTVRRVVNEPTAAALAAGLVTDPGVGGGVDAGVDVGGWAGSLLVYDLGGGTFDVTALRVEPGAVHVLATAGDRNLGGFDFDNALMHLLDERFRAAGGPSLLADDATEVDLRERAELVKHTLTSVEKAVAHLAADGVARSVTVTRDDFEHLTSALLSRTRDTAEQVVEEAGLTWAEVDRIVLAGGSTRMPMVRRMLTEISGRAPDATANPDEVVALGAARMAHLLERAERPPEPEPRGRSSGLRSTKARFGLRRRERTEESEEESTASSAGMRLAVHDVTSHGLGQILYRRGTEIRFNRVIIARNTPIPAQEPCLFYTRYNRQDELEISITEGDETDLAHVRVLGKEVLSIGPYPKGFPFETTLAYDENQIIFVQVRDLTTGELVGTFEIEHVLNPNAERVAAATDRIRAISPL
ncbi:molecular chaperone DnaK [Actinopolymorpha cephalotaxi]|uniref:Molecular chaperone DnaK n=1 Tax=Actinopolymorpha cephalotaxi TaxID=504797 RepID=A0A1I2U7U0_9ACTN|nr:Hsp70 family protein [Actinopolymorpha cephalotaxi]NYH86478.1 molecular chaperone DnaK [Actinopolymorpha cephalotaxi]SFG73214.1 molecular chaperone DnaK [Actinopolymorpha cephalotaxi]